MSIKLKAMTVKIILITKADLKNKLNDNCDYKDVVK